MKRIISVVILTVFIIQAFSTTLSASEKLLSFEQLTTSGDIIVTESAKDAAPSSIPENPDDVDAGVVVIMTAASLIVGAMTVASWGLTAYEVYADIDTIGKTLLSIETELSKIDDPEMWANRFESLYDEHKSLFGDVNIELFDSAMALIAAPMLKKITKDVIIDKSIEKAMEHVAVRKASRKVITIVNKKVGTQLAKQSASQLAKNINFIVSAGFLVWDSVAAGMTVWNRHQLKTDLYNLATTDDAKEYLKKEEFDPDYFQKINELIKNGKFEDGLSNWEYRNVYTANSFGSISGDSFAVIHTGLGNSSDQGWVRQSFNTEKNASVYLNVKYNFVTCEWPTWWGTQYNDKFKIRLYGSNIGTPIDYAKALNDIPNDSFLSVNNLPSNIMDSLTAGATGWGIKTWGPIWLPSTKKLFGGHNSNYSIKISVHDVGDKIVDSALLVDNVSLR